MNSSIIISEIDFKAIRSSGAGGQHVNKVSSKIELSFDIQASKGISDEEKLLILKKLSSRTTKLGVLKLSCGDTRSQYRNKKQVTKRLFEILKSSLHIPAIRKSTTPTKASIKKRLELKKHVSLKKSNRKKLF